MRHDLFVAAGRSERAASPDWWRGTTPRLLPGFGARPIGGEIRELDVSVLPGSGRSLLRQVFFHQAHASGIDLSLDDVALAVCWSEFDRCTFRQRSRRLKATGAARLVSCRFERCHFNGHFSRTTDYIGCTFTGNIDGCVWYGTIPPGDRNAGRRNVITGNDLTGVTFGPNVGWRGEIDVTAQICTWRVMSTWASPPSPAAYPDHPPNSANASATG